MRAPTVVRKIGAGFVGLFFAAFAWVFAGAIPQSQAQAAPKDENSHDLFAQDTVYTLTSDFKRSALGSGDSLYDDLSYDHRFPIKGKWYFRTGFEYERFDFRGTDNGLPEHLQATYAHLALEYVVHDHAGAGIELDPGAYFQDNITGDAVDVPWKIFVSFPLKKDKIFGVVGLGGGLFQDPIVAPGGGIIWLFNDQLRLEGVFPKPALVYSPSDNWQFRLVAHIQYESFRTDDLAILHGAVALHDAVLQYSEDRVGVQARYSGLKPFQVVAGAGYTFRREFDFFRAKVTEKVDPAPYFRLNIEAKF